MLSSGLRIRFKDRIEFCAPLTLGLTFSNDPSNHGSSSQALTTPAPNSK